ncbi:MAG TPA: crosslink repair DNA glycosylase YcaQ family protein, partial [Thermoanaerobaculia bacterium]|nr:crosslink repair DNA glycosylase YcaQ family protein [Thermoanaerobaculia bacterium]
MTSGPAASIDARRARRLSLAKAGLLRSDASTLPRRASGSGRRARQAALEVIDRFGYLQLDTVSVAGARSHALVLLSRLEGMDPALGESLLQPGEPLFEYWGHEASWLPIELYPVFAFRRVAFRRHPWWGDLISEHRRTATEILERIRSEGPLRSVDLEGKSGTGWWNLKLTKRLANALWSSGELAIRERRSFQRSYDLPERVIPAHLLGREVPRADAFEALLLRALEGFGWATTSTLAQTWRLRNARADIDGALQRLVERGAIVPCKLAGASRA